MLNFQTNLKASADVTTASSKEISTAAIVSAMARLDIEQLAASRREQSWETEDGHWCGSKLDKMSVIKTMSSTTDWKICCHVGLIGLLLKCC